VAARPKKSLAQWNRRFEFHRRMYVIYACQPHIRVCVALYGQRPRDGQNTRTRNPTSFFFIFLYFVLLYDGTTASETRRHGMF
jgi:hypothetical protein